MDLSYEETMRRSFSYERCNMKHYPWDVSVFKGENQIIVLPEIITMGGYSTYMAWHLLLSESVSAKAIGEAVIEAFEHIRISPVDARQELKENVKKTIFGSRPQSANHTGLLTGNIYFALCICTSREILSSLPVKALEATKGMEV